MIVCKVVIIVDQICCCLFDIAGCRKVANNFIWFNDFHSKFVLIHTFYFIIAHL